MKFKILYIAYAANLCVLSSIIGMTPEFRKGYSPSSSSSVDYKRDPFDSMNTLSSHGSGVDRTYRYREIDIESRDSTISLEDEYMAFDLTRYQENNRDALMNSQKILLHCLEKYTGTSLSARANRCFDYNNHQRLKRRLSFVSRLVVEIAKKPIQYSFGYIPTAAAPSIESTAIASPKDEVAAAAPSADVSHQPVTKAASDLAEIKHEDLRDTDLPAMYDFMLTTPTDGDLINKGKPPSWEEFKQTMEELLTAIEQGGIYSTQQAASFSKHFILETAQRIAHIGGHPVEYAQGIARANMELIKEATRIFLEISIFMPDETMSLCPEIQQYRDKIQQKILDRRLKSFQQTYDHLCETIPQMSPEDYARICAHLCIDNVLAAGVGKGLAVATKIPPILRESPFLESIHSKIRQTLSATPEIVTAEGIVFKSIKDESGALFFQRSDKVIPTTGIQREIMLPKVQTYEQARNKALEIIGKVDVHTGQPHIGKQGACKNKIDGRSWHDGKVVVRLDCDPTKGPHINVTDFRLGKGITGIEICIPFEGTEQAVEGLLKSLNTHAMLQNAKIIFKEKENLRDLARITKILLKME